MVARPCGPSPYQGCVGAQQCAPSGVRPAVAPRSPRVMASRRGTGVSIAGEGGKQKRGRPASGDAASSRKRGAGSGRGASASSKAASAKKQRWAPDVVSAAKGSCGICRAQAKDRRVMHGA